VSARTLVAAAAALSLALATTYAALGGGRYDPPGTADPCEQRDLRAAESTEAIVEWLVLAALDGAACDLEVSREEVTLALFSDGERERFARRHDLDAGDVEGAVRAGLVRAVEEAERSGALERAAAALLRAAARLVPLDSVIDNLQIE
jgi:hypothetical protein